LFDLPFKTDNQAVNEQLTEALKLLKEGIYLKGCCLEACKDGFTVEEYQKTKSVKAIEAEKTGKKKVEIKDDTMDKSPLYAALSAWRLEKSKELGAPAYTVAANKTLKAIAQAQPVTLAELKDVKGMGVISVKRFGAEILDIVLRFMGGDPETADLGEMPEEPVKKEKKPKGETYRITKEMFDSGMSVEAIAKERGFAISTIYGHLARLVEQGLLEASQFVEKEKYNEILEYFESTFDPNLTMAKEVLGEDYQYGEIRAVLAELEQEHFFENQPNEGD
jgi:transposase